jgi:hypothetical protein
MTISPLHRLPPLITHHHLPPPCTGCLPTLATIPIFIGLYSSLTNVANAGDFGDQVDRQAGLQGLGDKAGCTATS